MVRCGWGLLEALVKRDEVSRSVDNRCLVKREPPAGGDSDLVTLLRLDVLPRQNRVTMCPSHCSQDAGGESRGLSNSGVG